MERTRKFVGKNVDLDRLCTRIGNFLIENNYQISYSKIKSVNPQTHLIQAKKADIFHRAFGTSGTDIIIHGSSFEFEISIETGVWGKTLNLYSPLSEIPSFDNVAKTRDLYPGKKLKEKFWPFIQYQIDDLEDSNKMGEPIPRKKYSCDYIDGYPGWKQPILRGNLILEYQQGHRCLMFSFGEDKGVMIPPLKMIKAEIISQKTKISNPDRIVKLTFRDQKGRKHKPIFNFEDGDVRSVFAGINEIIRNVKQEISTIRAIH